MTLILLESDINMNKGVAQLEADMDNGYCPSCDQEYHCDHWSDGEPCCHCGWDSPEPDVEPGYEPGPYERCVDS